MITKDGYVFHKRSDATRHTGLTNTDSKGTVPPNEGEVAKAVVRSVHDRNDSTLSAASRQSG